jgi:hypothetical protein
MWSAATPGPSLSLGDKLSELGRPGTPRPRPRASPEVALRVKNGRTALPAQACHEYVQPRWLVRGTRPAVRRVRSGRCGSGTRQIKPRLSRSRLPGRAPSHRPPRIKTPPRRFCYFIFAKVSGETDPPVKLFLRARRETLLGTNALLDRSIARRVTHGDRGCISARFRRVTRLTSW